MVLQKKTNYLLAVLPQQLKAAGINSVRRRSGVLQHRHAGWPNRPEQRFDMIGITLFTNACCINSTTRSSHGVSESPSSRSLSHPQRRVTTNTHHQPTTQSVKYRKKAMLCLVGYLVGTRVLLAYSSTLLSTTLRFFDI